jgi:hypothetical protein
LPFFLPEAKNNYLFCFFITIVPTLLVALKGATFKYEKACKVLCNFFEASLTYEKKRFVEKFFFI